MTMTSGSKTKYYYLNANLGTGQWIFTLQPTEYIVEDSEIELGRVIYFTDPEEYGVYIETEHPSIGMAFLKASSAITRFIKEGEDANQNGPCGWRKDFGQL